MNAVKERVTIYDEIAPRWDEFKAKPRDLLLKPVLELLHRNWNVLDAGCGNGVPAREIAKCCCSVVCLDNSRAMLERAKKNLAETKNAAIVFGDLRELPFEGKTFDAVACIAAFHHLDYRGRKKAAAEFRRVLKKEGRVIATLWRPEKLVGKKWALVKWGKQRRKYFFPSDKSLKKIFNDVGFRFVRVSRLGKGGDLANALLVAEGLNHGKG